MNRTLFTLLGLSAAALATTIQPQPQASPSPNRTEQLFIVRPSLDPARFTAKITNPWFPLTPGTQFVYQEKTPEATRRVEVSVGLQTRQIMGITVREVHDRVTLAGKLVEDTYDWYAQDTEGDVWYFGEDTKEYQGGKVVSTAGTWKAGVGGAVPGIVMRANPALGDTYRQEYWKGQAEDMGQIIGLRGVVSVPAGKYQNLLVIAEWNPLKPAELMHKYYARGVGEVAKTAVQGATETGVLLSVQRR